MVARSNQAQLARPGPNRPVKSPLPSCSRPAGAPPTPSHRHRDFSASREHRRHPARRGSPPSPSGPRLGPDLGLAGPASRPPASLRHQGPRRRASSHPTHGNHAVAPDQRPPKNTAASPRSPHPRCAAGRDTPATAGTAQARPGGSGQRRRQGRA
nr:uncharacterized protein LOC127340439 [Lolium perenne]